MREEREREERVHIYIYCIVITYHIFLVLITFVDSNNNLNWKEKERRDNQQTHPSIPHPSMPHPLHTPLASRAILMDSRVCSITPSSAATTSTTISVTLAPLALIELNAAWPGVSRNVILLLLGNRTNGSLSKVGGVRM